MEIQNFFNKPGSNVWAALLSSCQLHGPVFSVLGNFFLYASVQNMQVTKTETRIYGKLKNCNAGNIPFQV